MGQQRPRRLSRSRLLVVLVATLLFDLALLILDNRLKQTGGPSILGLEFAGSGDAVSRIASEWGPHGVYLARLSLWLDFGFMVSYGAFFTLAGFATRDLARSRGHRLVVAAGSLVPFFAMGATWFDFCENVIWLSVLSGRAIALAPVATVCAITKFTLIAIAIAYSLIGLGLWLWSFRTT